MRQETKLRIGQASTAHWQIGIEGDGLLIAILLLAGDSQEGQLHHRHGNAGRAVGKCWQVESPYGWTDETIRGSKMLLGRRQSFSRASKAP
ncbi:hypothetical protein BSN85_17810 [Bradyrhizobium brasilense]|nr:hypothetical protein BSN85_17810 [Bradyrhizobium brasilense]